MKVNVVMPKMGESITEGTLIKWHKQPGERVERDEIIFEIETDKVATDIPSPSAGVLAEVLVRELDTVAVGTLVAVIETEGGPPAAVGLPAEASTDERFYSPAVRGLAGQERVTAAELDSIAGSGRGGRVTRGDLQGHLEKKKAAAGPAAEADPDRQVLAMNPTRRMIMRRMIQSRDTAVHVTQVVEADLSAVQAFIDANKNAWLRDTGLKLTCLPFVAFAAIQALKQFAWLNASIENESIVLKKRINLGIAVAVEPHELVVPNIKDAGGMSLRELMQAIADLAGRARAGKLSTQDVSGGSFSLTNYGVFGTLIGTPIIIPPELGILGLGAVVRRPVVAEAGGVEALVIRPMMYLALSHDHRLVDGMLGAGFLKAVRQGLEGFDPVGV